MSTTGEIVTEQHPQSTMALLLSMASLLSSYALLMAGTGLFATFPPDRRSVRPPSCR